MSSSIWVKCPNCKGSGKLEDLTICPTCKGKGIISEIPWYVNPNITCQYVGNTDMAKGDDNCTISLLKIDEDGNINYEFGQECGNDFLKAFEDIVSKYVNKDIKNN